MTVYFVYYIMEFRKEVCNIFYMLKRKTTNHKCAIPSETSLFAEMKRK